MRTQRSSILMHAFLYSLSHLATSSRELSSTFARLCRVVDTATTEMNTELKDIETSLAVIEANQKQIKVLSNKANFIQRELEIFDSNYIKEN